MHAAVRPYVTAGAALVGASVIAVTPIAAPTPDIHVANPAMRLAAKSIANVPVNLIETIANIPANEIYALNQWSAALIAGESWFLKTPTNVWGWDPANPAMVEAAVAVLVPFPALSGNGGLPSGGLPTTSESSYLGGSAPPGTLGYMLNVIAAAEFPMRENCGFECPDVLSLLEGWFKVPLSQLISGYTFPTVIDTNDPTYPVAWSGQTAAPLDPLEPIRLFIDSLMEDPSESEIKTVSLQDIITTAKNLDASATVAFNPWFPGSYIFTGFPLYDQIS